MTPIFSHTVSALISLTLYAAATISGLSGMMLRKMSLQKAGCFLTLAGFLFQTLTLIMGFHASFSGGLPGGAYLQLLAWFVVLTGVFLWFRLKVLAPLLFAAPFCLTLFLLSLSYMEHAITLPKGLQASFYLLHIATLYVSLACTCIAFIVSSLFLLTERKIKHKQRMRGLLADVPSLQLMDRINKICLLCAFPLYTVGMISGFIQAQPAFGPGFSHDPKVLLSLVIWMLLAIVFHNRLAKNWTGRKPALWIFCIFLLSLFSLLIVNTVMDSHHAFIR